VPELVLATGAGVDGAFDESLAVAEVSGAGLLEDVAVDLAPRLSFL
jgi:hypothetical protein